MFVCNPLFYQTILVQLFRLLGREQYMLLCLLGGSIQVRSHAIRCFTKL